MTILSGKKKNSPGMENTREKGTEMENTTADIVAWRGNMLVPASGMLNSNHNFQNRVETENQPFLYRFSEVIEVDNDRG